MKRVLVIKMSSLGDVVHAMPAVADAVAAGWQVDWVVEEAFADIPRMHPGVHQVLPIAWRRWRRHLLADRGELAAFRRSLRQQDYDVVLDSQGLIKSAVVSVLAAGTARRRIAGFSHTSAREPWAAFAYGRGLRVAPQQHAIDRQRQLFAQALGYPLQGVPPAIQMVDAADTDVAVSDPVFLLHGTTWDSKHWPDTMWVSLVEEIVASGFTPVVTWGDPIEQARAELLGRHGAHVLAKTSLMQLAQHLRRSRLVITVDSGIGHLSAVLGIPTLGLYGATDGQLTGCRGAQATHLQGQAPCVPCIRRQCQRYTGPPLLWREQPVQPPCFAALPPQRVWQQGLAMIRAAS